MADKTHRSKLIIIIVSSVVFVGLVGWGATLLSNHAKQKGSKTTDFTTQQGYYDPNSHQTISNPSGKTPDLYGAMPGSPVFLGLNALLNNGLTLTQVGDYKFALYQFVKSNKIAATEASIAVDSVTTPPIDPDRTTDTLTIYFNIVINRKTIYKAVLDYSNLDTAQLKLTDSAGTQVYDSGPVTNQNVY
ncbi:MAG TPA: hypothetical protein VIR03_01545 [Candidatus Saccharimonadales bacterium]